MIARRRGRRAAALALVVLLAAAAAPFGAVAELAVPKLMGRVNDLAGLLTLQQRSQLEVTLSRFAQSTTTQVVVLTIPSLEGEDIEGFSIRVAEAWKIGLKGLDNGVILVVAPKEHKVRIEVGYGLEGALTDAESSQIIRGVMVPAFRENDYPGGITEGVDAIIEATRGEFQAPPDSGRPRHKSIVSTIVMFLIISLLLSTRTGRFILLASMMSGGRGFGGSSGRGGFSGGGGSFGGGGASGSW